jgi:hypothetical protein
LRLGASPKDLLMEGGEPLLMELLKGINVDVKFNVWKKIADVLIKLVESGDIDPALMPIFGGLAPAFLLRINGKLDIEIDDYMKQKITENPLVEPILMDANTLIGATSSITSDEDLEEHLNTLAQNNGAVGLVLRILIKHLGDEIEFSALTPHIGVKGRIHGEGLNLVAKTLAKYMK